MALRLLTNADCFGGVLMNGTGILVLSASVITTYLESVSEQQWSISQHFRSELIALCLALQPALNLASVPPAPRRLRDARDSFPGGACVWLARRRWLARGRRGSGLFRLFFRPSLAGLLACF
jgi:hypothetical protein